MTVNADIVARADQFYGYKTLTDFRLETRHPQPPQVDEPVPERCCRLL
jgi:hypothetical protein